MKFNEEVLGLAVLYELEFKIYLKRMVLRVTISEMFTRRKNCTRRIELYKLDLLQVAC